MTRGADRIGVFGGSFDPPHLGHVAVAEDVADALRLDRVLWIPARRSPLKNAPGSPAAVRLEMVRAAAGADPRFRVDTRELDRPAPSYTVDTLEELRTEHGPDAELFLIMGHDQYGDLDRWQRPERIRALATVVVVDREGRGLEADGPRVGGEDVVPVPIRRVDVSSTEIRRRAARGETLAGRVPPPVAEIIERTGIYA